MNKQLAENIKKDLDSFLGLMEQKYQRPFQIYSWGMGKQHLRIEIKTVPYKQPKQSFIGRMFRAVFSNAQLRIIAPVIECKLKMKVIDLKTNAKYLMDFEGVIDQLNAFEIKRIATRRPKK